MGSNEPTFFCLKGSSLICITIIVLTNTYGHPHRETLDLVDSESWKFKVYRTDTNGDIVVRSNGKELSFETSR